MSKYRITFEGRVYEMEVELVSDSMTKQPLPEKKNSTPEAVRPKTDPEAAAAKTEEHPDSPEEEKGFVKSPMPGTVIRLMKAEGDPVKAGEVVLILEAMKMENEITSPVDGTVIKMYHAVGETVSGGEKLFAVR